jgi:predicted dehydrogenase
MSDKVKAVLVGCGGISRAWLGAIKDIPDIEMVAFVDLVEERAQEQAETYGWTDALVTADMEAAIEQTNPDAVFDCTVPAAHKMVTLTALEHGCHVLGEKPLADSLANAREMVAAAEKSGKTYAVIQNRRYDPNIRRFVHFLDSGTIGDITTVNADFYIGAHFGGFRAEMEHVLLLDMAIHTIDAGRMISGADPRAVTCVEWNPPGSWYDQDASAVAVFEMSDGVVFTYRGCWCAEGLNTTWEADWRVVCTEGSATWDGAEGFKAQTVKDNDSLIWEGVDVPVPPFDPGEKVGSHGGVIREFVRSIQTGETPETICSDNIKSLAMVFGAIESAEKGCRVEIDV